MNAQILENLNKLIIDDKDVYHFGASLNDLGKKWFAFFEMVKTAFALWEHLKKV